jgi:hypothetical protein
LKTLPGPSDQLKTLPGPPNLWLSESYHPRFSQRCAKAKKEATHGGGGKRAKPDEVDELAGMSKAVLQARLVELLGERAAWESVVASSASAFKAKTVLQLKAALRAATPAGAAAGGAAPSESV